MVGVVLLFFIFSPTNEEIIERENREISIKGNQEKVLFSKVKKVPSSDYEKNIKLYEELSELNPTKKLYVEKVKHYKNLLSDKIEEKSKNITETNTYNIYENKNSEYSDSLKVLENAGAFVKDNVNRSILVETGFWNSMDYQKKKAFCFMINKTYPIYGHSILDKYSGKKLSEVNMFGEVSVNR